MSVPRPATAVAPGRVNLIGEHVDYHGGTCLPFALEQSTRVAVRPRTDDVLALTSDDRSWRGRLREVPDAPAWVRYAAGVLVVLDVRSGLDVEIGTDLPLGAGLSSSAALECAVAVAVDAALGLALTPEDVAEACVRAETEVVGAPTGGLDQAVSVHARAGHALLLDFATGAREHVPFDPAAAGLGVLVVDTRVVHDLTDGRYAARREESDAAARRLGVPRLAGVDPGLPDVRRLPGPLRRRVRHVVTEVGRVADVVAALRREDWAAVGPLLDASHASLREDYEVSCPELDVACEAARGAGALGARLVGGGFGGSAIALVPHEHDAAVRAAVRTAFRARGWREPAFLDARPGPGAREVVHSRPQPG